MCVCVCVCVCVCREMRELWGGTRVYECMCAGVSVGRWVYGWVGQEGMGYVLTKVLAKNPHL